MITIKNSFHNSQINLNVQIGDYLTNSQIKRSKRILCGVHGCTCSGIAGDRGTQDGFYIEQTDINKVQILTN